MKALVLAAGFGRRLEPYTHTTPKPLFTIAQRPLLDIVIRKLSAAGITAICVNTHHLYHKIETYLAEQTYDIPVTTCYEPEILGTGGAIKNLTDFWDNEPFMVVNSDILFCTDLTPFVQYHRQSNALATLVLCDDTRFNQVWVDPHNKILGFGLDNEPESEDVRAWTFTGIQIIEPRLLELIPEKKCYSVINAYRAALCQNQVVQAYIPKQIVWTDIGSPNRYRKTAISRMALEAFADEDPDFNSGYETTKLAGDGSDRCWYRLQTAKASIIMADHGIRSASGVREVDAFVHIGRHLLACGVKAPRILSADSFSGLVFMQDLGDRHLQDVVHEHGLDSKKVEGLYKNVIIQLVKMGTFCRVDFETKWTYQSAGYDYQMVLEKECRYFVTAFLNDYLEMSVRFEDLLNEFQLLARKAAACQYQGFMHRDMQSRNIMVYQNQGYVIDFQGGRLGPLAYDLASLLIDPYAALPAQLAKEFYDYYVQQLCNSMELERSGFRKEYEICRLTRNLQILGAFGHLTHNKGKQQFETYIPGALTTLDQNLNDYDQDQSLTALRDVVHQAQNRLEVLNHRS